MSVIDALALEPGKIEKWGVGPLKWRSGSFVQMELSAFQTEASRILNRYSFVAPMKDRTPIWAGKDSIASTIFSGDDRVRSGLEALGQRIAEFKKAGTDEQTSGSRRFASTVQKRFSSEDHERCMEGKCLTPVHSTYARHLGFAAGGAAAGYVLGKGVEQVVVKNAQRASALASDVRDAVLKNRCDIKKMLSVHREIASMRPLLEKSPELTELRRLANIAKNDLLYPVLKKDIQHARVVLLVFERQRPFFTGLKERSASLIPWLEEEAHQARVTVRLACKQAFKKSMALTITQQMMKTTVKTFSIAFGSLGLFISLLTTSESLNEDEFDGAAQSAEMPLVPY